MKVDCRGDSVAPGVGVGFDVGFDFVAPMTHMGFGVGDGVDNGAGRNLRFREVAVLRQLKLIIFRHRLNWMQYPTMSVNVHPNW